MNVLMVKDSFEFCILFVIFNQFKHKAYKINTYAFFPPAASTTLLDDIKDMDRPKVYFMSFNLSSIQVHIRLK